MVSGFHPETLFVDSEPNNIWNRVYMNIPPGLFHVAIQSEFSANQPDVKAALDDISYYTVPCYDLG